MIAILSDIHGNLEALQAVLADANYFGVDAIYCLGDLVGYGPDPIPCVDLAMGWQVVLMGNHDEALLGDDELDGWTATAARLSVLRARRQMQEHENGSQLLDFTAQCPAQHAADDALLVHGSPRNPLHEHLFPEDIQNEHKLEAVAALFDKVCFCGHTHLPGIFQPNQAPNRRQSVWEFLGGESRPTNWQFLTPEECGHEFAIGREKIICNVGSVGQPRDGDPRACYVLYEPERIQFRRVEYDLEATIEKLESGEDGDALGQRLRLAR